MFGSNTNNANSSFFQPLSKAWKMYIRLLQLYKQFYTEHLKRLKGDDTVRLGVVLHSVFFGLFSLHEQ